MKLTITNGSVRTSILIPEGTEEVIVDGTHVEMIPSPPGVSVTLASSYLRREAVPVKVSNEWPKSWLPVTDPDYQTRWGNAAKTGVAGGWDREDERLSDKDLSDLEKFARGEYAADAAEGYGWHRGVIQAINEIRDGRKRFDFAELQKRQATWVKKNCPQQVTEVTVKDIIGTLVEGDTSFYEDIANAINRGDKLVTRRKYHGLL